MPAMPASKAPLPASAPSVSFEFFPPKTTELEAALWHAVEVLAPIGPSFVSVTYGAGGGTRARTHEIVSRLQQEKGLNAAAHLTCVGSTKAEIEGIAHSYWGAGIRHIVALRGDLPEGHDHAADGYRYADELVEGLLALHPFNISVGGYPEVHPEAVSAEADLEALKKKCDAGARRVITQFFFDNADFLRFRDRAAAAGIQIPILPGILPITNFARMVSFAKRCGAKVPEEYHRLFVGHDAAAVLVRQKIAEEVAVEQCLALRADGVDHFHFYTLNRAELVAAICQHLGVAAYQQKQRA